MNRRPNRDVRQRTGKGDDPVLFLVYAAAHYVGRARSGEHYACQQSRHEGEDETLNPHPELGHEPVPLGDELVHEFVQHKADADGDERDTEGLLQGEAPGPIRVFEQLVAEPRKDASGDCRGERPRLARSTPRVCPGPRSGRTVWAGSVFLRCSLPRSTRRIDRCSGRRPVSWTGPRCNCATPGACAQSNRSPRSSCRRTGGTPPHRKNRTSKQLIFP